MLRSGVKSVFARLIAAAIWFAPIAPTMTAFVPIQSALAEENEDCKEEYDEYDPYDDERDEDCLDDWEFFAQYRPVSPWPWEPKPPGPQQPRHYETFAGADVANTVWLAYAGTTLAPFSDIHQDGLRLRFNGGYGQYVYNSRSTAPPFQHQQYRAAVVFQEALIGYLKRMGPLTGKALIGVAKIEHQIRPHDEWNIVQGPDFGVKGAVELWLNINNKTWASLDLAWAQAHNTRSARTRIGRRVMDNVSLGLEATINVDAQAEYKINEEVISHRSTAFDYARVGAFVRGDWYGGELSASGGLLGDFTQNKSPYATINWIRQY